MPANDQRPVFTYQTRVTLTAEQDQMLSECAVLFGQVERTLFVDLQKGERSAGSNASIWNASILLPASSMPRASRSKAK